MEGKWYLCRLKPSEEYFFGGERTFDFEGNAGAKKEEKTSYYIRSEKWPNQSTLLGVLRFLVLKKHGKLSDWNERLEVKDLIGQEGFSLSDSTREYGKIKEITPVFMMDELENRWIRTPINHKAKKNEEDYNTSYVPMKTQKNALLTDRGEVYLPQDYIAKDGLTESIINIGDGVNKSNDIIQYPIMNIEKYPGVPGVLKAFEKIGIARGLTDDGFFKKQFWQMDKDFSFAFYCRAEQDAFDKSDIVYVGQGKSTFQFTSKELNYDPIEKMSNDIRLINIGEKDLYYALSDLYLEDNSIKGYSIVKKKYFRSLGQTPVEGQSQNDKQKSFRNSKKKSKLYELIEAGSVFFYDPIINKEKQEGYKQVGLNYIIKVEGSSDEK
ncbi:MAG: hypothetical protein K6E85_16970 [Lachnospiraceae bacterium]|nr:hypothetical protein [Lachnospiraceae bacterium]